MKIEELTLKNVAAIAPTWSQEELEGLKALAENLLNALSAEDRAIPALHLLLQGRKGGGYFEDKIIRGKSYRYLRYRFDKMLRSIYLGKTECFVSPLSREAEAAMGFRDSCRVLCRLHGILQRFNPITPLDAALLMADIDKFSPQIKRVLDGKPPQKKPNKASTLGKYSPRGRVKKPQSKPALKG